MFDPITARVVYIDRLPSGEPFYVGAGRFVRMAINKRNEGHTRAREAHPDWKREVFCIGDYEYCQLIERRLIAHFGRIDNGSGTLVNQTDGGHGTAGILISDAARFKQSAARMGHEVTAETRQKMRASMLRTWADPATKKRRSDGMRAAWARRKGAH